MTQTVDCLPSTREALDSILSTIQTGDICHPSTWEMEAEGPKVEGYHWLHNDFEASLGYMRLYLK